MSENTKIEWCDHSWSPWRGCTKVSAGCANCYAETLSKRNPKVLGEWDKGKPRVLAKNWGDPVKWDKGWNKAQYFTRIQGQPEPSKPTVFPSLCDWLDEEVPIEWTARFLGLIYDTPNLMWLLVTKRPENWSGLIQEVKRYALRKANPPREHVDASAAALASHWSVGDYPINVWIGASVEDQPTADRIIPWLLKIPAVGRLLCLEPLLGPVDLVRDVQHHSGPLHKASPIACLDWLIIGGESGHGARPCNVEWVRSLVKQGKAAGVPVFVKQLGAAPMDRNDRGFDGDSGPRGWPMDTNTVDDQEPGEYQGKRVRVRLRHPKGGDPSEWAADVRVREFPEGLR